MTELLTLAQVAERLRISRRTVDRLVSAGRLRAVKQGRLTFVTSTELERYVAGLPRRVA